MAQALHAEVLFDQPQRRLAPKLRALLHECVAVDILVGFMTVEGVKAVSPALFAKPTCVRTMVIGAGTQRGFDAIDALLAGGVSSQSIFVHLGHSRMKKAVAAGTSTRKRKPFYEYHPMLHGKIYFFELPNSESAAIIGSHNLTGFALMGLNGEAAVLLRGPSSHPELRKVKQHIDAARAQSQPYFSALKDGYAWWARESLEGIADKVTDREREHVYKPTIILLAQKDTAYPKKDDVVYFELPHVLRQKVIEAEVHLYVFDPLPSTPTLALRSLSKARSFWAVTKGVVNDRGGKEIAATWDLSGPTPPKLRYTASGVRPVPPTDSQQVHAQIRNQIFDEHEYLFSIPAAQWSPVLNPSSSIAVNEEDEEVLRSLNLVPPQHLDWYLVSGVTPADSTFSREYQRAIEARTPTSGNFILLSLWRKKHPSDGAPRAGAG